MASWAETERKIRAELSNLLKSRRENKELLELTPDRDDLSEKGKTELPVRHNGFQALKNSEEFLDPRTLLEHLRLKQSSLYQALADMYPSEAAFNPVRQYEVERCANAPKGQAIGACT
jgi:hypothetical protein